MSVKLYKPYLNLFNRISLLQKIAKDFAEVGEQITSDTYLRCFFEFNCFSTSVKILLPYIEYNNETLNIIVFFKYFLIK